MHDDQYRLELAAGCYEIDGRNEIMEDQRLEEYFEEQCENEPTDIEYWKVVELI